jgi:3-isopropylmalate/(R)-2-methylmalate dehydratase small subunit
MLLKEELGMGDDLDIAASFYKEIVEGFIFHDIQAAIDGKANYLAALGLVCYTEFLGGLARGTFSLRDNRCNFECFFDRLGQGYKAFRQNHDAEAPERGKVYHIYRCGLVHEYLIKIKSPHQSATVFMSDTSSKLPIGVGLKQDGGYYLVVETYFRDFKKAAEQLLEEVKTDPDALRRFVKALNSVLHRMKIRGRVHKYGANVDTDVIIPARYLNVSDARELAAHCLEDLDPDFVKKVQPGDIIVAETNFGCGSSREHAPLAIKTSGVGAVIARSFARIFYRNAINIGLPILECEEAVAGTRSGEELEVDLASGEVRNLSSGQTYRAKPYPEFMLQIMEAGGLIEHTRRRLGVS